MSLPSTLLAALVVLLASTQAEPPETHRDLIHSDLPLWAGGPEVMWPRSFGDADTSGCETRVHYGDWRFDEQGSEDDPVWYRLSNYGVFHCFMLVREAELQSELGGGHPDPSYFIELGTARGREGTVELWALQRGSRPGSDYLLLSRTSAAGAVSAFDVLQRECPSDRMREGANLSILITSYCAINSRRELVSLARRMARRPPLGRLAFVSPLEDEE